MTAKIFFNLVAGSIIILCFVDVSSGQQVNDAATPEISSISPSQVAVGKQITITGAGLLSKNDQIIIDGIPSSYEIPLNDTTLAYKLVTYLYDGSGCAKAEKEAAANGKIIRCDPAPISLKPGQHTISVQNSQGTSNAFAFTVIPYQGSVSINANFVDFSSGNPTISGTANGVSKIYGIVYTGDWQHGLGLGYNTGPIKIMNGHWSYPLNNVTLIYGLPGSSPFRDVGPLAGMVHLQISDSNTGLTLFSGDLTVKK